MTAPIKKKIAYQGYQNIS